MKEKIVFSGILYNEEFKIRWNIYVAEKEIVIEENNEVQKSIIEFHVLENTEYSLFSSPLAKGSTLEEALNNFLKVEKELLKTL